MSRPRVVEAIAAETGVIYGTAPNRRYFRPGAFRKACRPERWSGLPSRLDHDPGRQVGVLLALWEDLERRVLLCRIALAGALGEHLAASLDEDPNEYTLSVYPDYSEKHYRELGGVRYVVDVPRLLEVSFCRAKSWYSWSPPSRNPRCRILKVA